MSNDLSKQKGKAASPDAAIKAADKGGITLTEEDLTRVSGGACATGQHIKKAVLEAGGEQQE